jgi:hypothetical protein
MARKFIALPALAALAVSPAAGFDSYWHAQLGLPLLAHTYRTSRDRCLPE